MNIMDAMQNEEMIPAGSSVEVEIQSKTVVLPIDKNHQVIEVLRYLYLISPSLPMLGLKKKEGTKLYVAVRL